MKKSITTSEIQDLVQNDYYRKWAAHMYRTIRLSVTPKTLRDPIHHIAVQMAILKVLEELEPKVTEGRKLGKSTGDKGVFQQAERNKLITKGYRSIADGMAFRQLGYDMVAFRILSQAHYAGFVADQGGPKAGRRSEIKYALRAVGRDAFVLIHDVTNHLRLADLSLFTPRSPHKPYLGEVKARKIITAGSIIHKMKTKKATSNQEKRLLQAQTSLEAGAINGPKVRSRAIRVDIPAPNYLNEISKLINKANELGYAWIEPHPMLVVEALNAQTLLESGDKYDRIRQEKPKVKSDRFIELSSSDVIDVQMQDEVMRTKVPYAVYPLSLRNRVRIISGEVVLQSTLYVDGLKEVFEARGWTLDLDEDAAVDKSTVETLSGPILFTDPGMSGFAFHAHHPNGFNVYLGWEHITKIGYEFFTPDYLVDLCEAAMKVAKPGDTENTHMANEAEARVWR